MAGPIPPLFFGSDSTGSSILQNTGTSTAGQIASSQNPQAFALFLKQAESSFLGSLFEEDDENGSSSLFGGSNIFGDLFGTSGLGSLPGLGTSGAGSILGSLGSLGISNPLLSPTANPADLGLLSFMIDRTVTVRDPSTGETTQGKVKSVEINGAQAIITFTDNRQALSQNVIKIE